MSDQHYNDDHFWLFLTHCCRDPILLKEAAAEVDPEHLRRFGASPASAIIWWVIRQFYNNYGHAPDVAALIAEFKAYIVAYARDAQQQASAGQIFAQFMAYGHKVGTESQELAYGLLRKIVRELKIEPEIEREVHDGLASKNYHQLGERITQLSRRHDGISRPLSRMGATQFSGEEGQRLPTYISWFDSRVSSPGPVRGGCMGIIAPTGGGKTSLGIQLAVEQSLSQQYSALILVEEWSRSVQRRILACATNIPTNKIEQAGDDLEKVIHDMRLDRELILAKREAVDNYMHVLDMTSEGDCQTVRNELQLFKQQQKLPNYLYLDWAGELADRVMALMPEYRDNKRGAISYICDETAKWAKEFDIFTAVSQQMDAETAQKGPFAKSNEYCAMDCRAFAVRQKYCMVLNPKDENTGIQIARVAKARDDAKPRPFALRLAGDVSRFQDASEQYEVNPAGRLTPAGAYQEQQSGISVPNEND